MSDILVVKWKKISSFNGRGSILKIFKALRKKSVISKLNRINMTRCNHASVIMLFLAAALWLIDKTVLKSSMYLMDYWGYIAADNILSAAMYIVCFIDCINFFHIPGKEETYVVSNCNRCVYGRNGNKSFYHVRKSIKR